MAWDATPEEPIAQALAVPFRRVGGEWEFCLITSARQGRWGFPKGIIDPGHTLESAALEEAWEEAGLEGRIVGRPLGGYRYRKWNRTLDVTAVMMEVTGARETWPECDVRQRRWCNPNEARERIDRDDQRALFDEALRRLTAGELAD